jgi:hypothetical protein
MRNIANGGRKTPAFAATASVRAASGGGDDSADPVLSWTGRWTIF